MAESLAERLERIKAAQAAEAEAKKAAKEEKAQARRAAKKEEAEVQKASQEDQAEILAWLRSIAAAAAPAPAADTDPSDLPPTMEGLFLGKTGCGMTFATKREIFNAFPAPADTNEETEDSNPAPSTPSMASGADGEAAPLEIPAKEPKPAPTTSQEDIRKARTRRLIQVGAITDQYLETAGLELEEVAVLLLQLVQLPEVMAVIHSQENRGKGANPWHSDCKKNPER